MSYIDQKHNEQQAKEAQQQAMAELNDKLASAFQKLMEGDDGEKAMHYLSSCLYGNTFGLATNSGIRDRSLFQLGMADVYLGMLVHIKTAGGAEYENLILWDTPYEYHPRPHNKEREHVKKAFKTDHGRFILQFYRSAFFDVAPQVSETDAVRLAGQRWIIQHILRCIHGNKAQEE